MLSFKKENRSINRQHVEELKASISEHGYLSCHPIITNEAGEIIDGQHRFLACQELGIEPLVLSIKDISDKLMIDLNKSQRCWRTEDYINFYSQKGNKHYELLNQFVHETKLAVTPALLILTNGDVPKFDKIKSGQMEIPFSVVSKEYEYAVYLAECANKIARYMKLPKGNKSIVDAVVVLSKISGFDLEYLMEKVSRYRDELFLCGSVKGYINLFLKLYNVNKKGAKVTLGD